MFKHILVPTDGSELSQKAIRNAAILARERRARLTVFHARPELRMPFYDEYIRIENDMWNECARLSGEEARRYLDDAARIGRAASWQRDEQGPHALENSGFGLPVIQEICETAVIASD